MKLAGVAQAESAVERHPAHHLRVGEVRGPASHLPDTGVGPAPAAADEVGDAGESTAGLAVEPPAGLRVDEGGLEQVAVDVQLGLRGGVVADRDRARAPVAVKLQRPLAAVEPVEDLQARVG
jgi:hypothetical protein